MKQLILGTLHLGSSSSIIVRFCQKMAKSDTYLSSIEIHTTQLHNRIFPGK